jgi:hypothetical protein
MIKLFQVIKPVHLIKFDWTEGKSKVKIETRNFSSDMSEGNERLTANSQQHNGEATEGHGQLTGSVKKGRNGEQKGA